MTGTQERPAPSQSVRAARLLAGASAGAVLGGAVIMLAGLVAAPGPWWQGYVSEAGVAGLPLAGLYRAGLIVLAVGVAGLGLRLRAVLLLVAAGLAAVSGAVPCTGGCPLPPFEASTGADVVHAGAAILGMVVLAGAMAEHWMITRDRAARWVSGIAVAITVPVGGALGLIMLFAGRVMLGAALERLLLVVAVAWLVGLGLTLLRSSVIVELWRKEVSRNGWLTWNRRSPR
ncbi:DUF998 domain-containing protein [Actinoplanes sp. NPDC049265]|uniref:DUF998 domain-containing protein n=1 Tax=Actinoplanes sp. NPDC049265 TaxID=3363902 RepID=UPI00371C50FF